MTTTVLSVSVPVADQDAALRFYTGVLGCELRTDVEVWPDARLVEVVPRVRMSPWCSYRPTVRSRWQFGWAPPMLNMPSTRSVRLA